MTIHRQMFSKNKEEPTMHRVLVEFEGGYFITLGGTCASFQKMIEECGRPTSVEFRATDEGWYQDEDGEDLITGRRDA